MELMTVDNRRILPDTEQDKSLPFTLVSELLKTTLSNDNEEILVEGNSQSFVYDINTGVQVGETLTATIFDVKTQQKEHTLEIFLNGAIETAEGFQQSCTLYFYMWWNHTLTAAPENQGLQQLKPRSMTIHPASLTERLSDAVFELDLYCRKKHQQQEALGHGRGYLVFGRTN